MSVNVILISSYSVLSGTEKKWVAILSYLFCRLFAPPRTTCHLRKSVALCQCTGVNLVTNTVHHHDWTKVFFLLCSSTVCKHNVILFTGVCVELWPFPYKLRCKLYAKKVLSRKLLSISLLFLHKETKYTLVHLSEWQWFVLYSCWNQWERRRIFARFL